MLPLVLACARTRPARTGRVARLAGSRRRGTLALGLSAQTWRRDWTIRKREATYAPSVYDALAAGLAPVPWKSEYAADWLTKTPPSRFSRQRDAGVERGVAHLARAPSSEVE